MIKKVKTYRDLLDTLGRLPYDQLNQPIRAWGEEVGFEVSYVEILDEDYYNPSGECAEPASLYTKEELEGENVVLDKGTILIGLDT